MHSISFFGLGNMGSGMASNLLTAGNRVTVYDLLESNITEMVAKGALASSSPSMAVSEADIVISMLPAGKHVKQL
jgi:3-hydroxyisobutyrate dehydrogenase